MSLHLLVAPDQCLVEVAGDMVDLLAENTILRKQPNNTRHPPRTRRDRRPSPQPRAKRDTSHPTPGTQATRQATGKPPPRSIPGQSAGSSQAATLAPPAPPVALQKAQEVNAPKTARERARDIVYQDTYLSLHVPGILLQWITPGTTLTNVRYLKMEIAIT